MYIVASKGKRLHVPRNEIDDKGEMWKIVSYKKVNNQGEGRPVSSHNNELLEDYKFNSSEFVNISIKADSKEVCIGSTFWTVTTKPTYANRSQSNSEKINFCWKPNSDNKAMYTDRPRSIS